MKRFFYTFFIFLLFVGTSKAQVDPLFFQQTNLRGLINPAATGKGGDINASLTTRQQWIGFSGMSTNAVQVHGFNNEIRSGFGAKFIMDKVGPKETKNVKINYAYFVPFDDVAFLSLGMGMGLMNTVHKGGDYFFPDPNEPNDPKIPMQTQKKTVNDFDFGVEFNTRNFEIGGAITHITHGWFDQKIGRSMRNFYGYSRYKAPINKYWDFIPGVTWHFNRMQTTYEAIAGVRYNNNFCVNVAYRNPTNLGIGLGLTVYEGLRLAYSYDSGFDNLSAHNSGSHEITISYNIPMNTSYIRNRLKFFQWKMF